MAEPAIPLPTANAIELPREACAIEIETREESQSFEKDRLRPRIKPHDQVAAISSRSRVAARIVRRIIAYNITLAFDLLKIGGAIVAFAIRTVLVGLYSKLHVLRNACRNPITWFTGYCQRHVGSTASPLGSLFSLLYSVARLFLCRMRSFLAACSALYRLAYAISEETTEETLVEWNGSPLNFMKRSDNALLEQGAKRCASVLHPSVSQRYQAALTDKGTFTAKLDFVDSKETIVLTLLQERKGVPPNTKDRGKSFCPGYFHHHGHIQTALIKEIGKYLVVNEIGSSLMRNNFERNSSARPPNVRIGRKGHDTGPLERTPTNEIIECSPDLVLQVISSDSVFQRWDGSCTHGAAQVSACVLRDEADAIAQAKKGAQSQQLLTRRFFSRDEMTTVEPHSSTFDNSAPGFRKSECDLHANYSTPGNVSPSRIPRRIKSNLKARSASVSSCHSMPLSYLTEELQALPSPQASSPKKHNKLRKRRRP